MEQERERASSSPFAGGSFVASAVLVVALVVALVVVGVRGLLGGGGAEVGAGGQVSVPTAASSGTAGSVCAMPAGDQEVPSGPLGVGRVEVAAGLSVPSVEGVGPGLVDQETGITSCFAHSPRGAVVAAVNFVKWLSSKRSWPEVVRSLTVAGSDQDRMVEAITSSWDGATNSAVRVHGYRVDEVRSADEVVVTVALSSETDPSALVSWPLVMVWDEGDWRVRLPSNDAWGTEVIEDLGSAGFSQWSV